MLLAAAVSLKGRVLASTSAAGGADPTTAPMRALHAPSSRPMSADPAACALQTREFGELRVYTLWPGGAHSFACIGAAGSDDSQLAFALLGDLSARWETSSDRTGFSQSMRDAIARFCTRATPTETLGFSTRAPTAAPALHGGVSTGTGAPSTNVSANRSEAKLRQIANSPARGPDSTRRPVGGKVATAWADVAAMPRNSSPRATGVSATAPPRACGVRASAGGGAHGCASARASRLPSPGTAAGRVPPAAAGSGPVTAGEDPVAAVNKTAEAVNAPAAAMNESSAAVNERVRQLETLTEQLRLLGAGGSVGGGGGAPEKNILAAQHRTEGEAGRDGGASRRASGGKAAATGKAAGSGGQGVNGGSDVQLGGSVAALADSSSPIVAPEAWHSPGARRAAGAPQRLVAGGRQNKTASEKRTAAVEGDKPAGEGDKKMAEAAEKQSEMKTAGEPPSQLVARGEYRMGGGRGAGAGGEGKASAEEEGNAGAGKGAAAGGVSWAAACSSPAAPSLRPGPPPVFPPSPRQPGLGAPLGTASPKPPTPSNLRTAAPAANITRAGNGPRGADSPPTTNSTRAANSPWTASSPLARTGGRAVHSPDVPERAGGGGGAEAAAGREGGGGNGGLVGPTGGRGGSGGGGGEGGGGRGVGWRGSGRRGGASSPHVRGSRPAPAHVAGAPPGTPPLGPTPGIASQAGAPPGTLPPEPPSGIPTLSPAAAATGDTARQQPSTPKSSARAPTASPARPSQSLAAPRPATAPGAAAATSNKTSVTAAVTPSVQVSLAPSVNTASAPAITPAATSSGTPVVAPSVTAAVAPPTAPGASSPLGTGRGGRGRGGGAGRGSLGGNKKTEAAAGDAREGEAETPCGEAKAEERSSGNNKTEEGSTDKKETEQRPGGTNRTEESGRDGGQSREGSKEAHPLGIPKTGGGGRAGRRERGLLRVQQPVEGCASNTTPSGRFR